MVWRYAVFKVCETLKKSFKYRIKLNETCQKPLTLIYKAYLGFCRISIYWFCRSFDGNFNLLCNINTHNTPLNKGILYMYI